ncbi:CPXCG motif-containing cysteine-rich protein [Luminiphilus sp.]|jgi:transcription elongation factor Elf1|nr:CPXCG motif-containing cysteine-rich protein [Luminiphilus sp.]
MSASALQETTVYCPYCGEAIVVLLNPEDVDTRYIEDCQVCCQPIEFAVHESSGGWLEAEVRSDNE